MQYEFRHRLLAFLYAASRAPLSTHYSAGALVAALEEEVSAREQPRRAPPMREWALLRGAPGRGGRGIRVLNLFRI